MHSPLQLEIKSIQEPVQMMWPVKV